MTHVYAAEIAKSYRDDNGDLVVEGIATSPDLDLDQQVCDPTWLKTAMPDWFAYGNVREQHGPNAAGTGTELEQQDGDRWHLKSIIVDPIAQTKVEKKVYKGYSIGIKDPRVVKDAAAPGGRIVGGSIVEISLVDRPCNPMATLALAKAAKPGMSVKAVNLDADRMLVKVEEIAEHPENADKPDATVHITADAEERAAVKAIRAEAEAARLAAARELVAARKAANPDLGKGTPAEDIAGAQAAIASIAQLIVSEAGDLAAGELGEACDIQDLLCAIDSLRWFICGEQAEASEDDDMSEVALWLAAQPEQEKAMGDTKTETTDTKATQPDTGKTVTTDTQTTGTPAVPAALTELVKAAVAEATKGSDERVKALEAELAKVKATPVPGGPVIARMGNDTQVAERVEKTAHFERLAKSVTDPDLRAFYRAELKKLAQNGA